MKNYYLLFLFTCSLSINAQTDCDDANYYLVSAYSHVKDAYDSRNVTHLKYYANRSLEAIKLSKKSLKNCDCETALNLADKAVDLLAKVEDAATWEDGRFYVKRARDISKESVIEIDKCSINTTINEDVSTENNDLINLQNEQLKLKQQQEALQRKAEDIKTKLALQLEKELQLKKEALIVSYKNLIAANIKVYNKTLKSSGCEYEVIKPIISFEDESSSDKDVKTHYINYLKVLASNYITQLNQCNP